MNFDTDAFAHGPIESKIWLCNEVALLNPLLIDNVFVLGSWSGTMPFLLYATNAIEFKRIFLVDTNAEYQQQARAICNALDCQGKLHILNQDANTVDYPVAKNFVINTSTDNISGNDWFTRIPAGTWIALQGRTGGHRDCVQSYNSINEFDEAYPLMWSNFLEHREFVYPDHSYTRFMKIGQK